MTDYKRFFIRVKKVYPFVVRELDPPSCLKDWSTLPKVKDRFLVVSGFSSEGLQQDKDDARMLFVAVVCQLADPLFFQFDYSINYKLRTEIGKIIGCSRFQISHTLKKVRNYMAVYPEFKAAVDDIYRLMCESQKA